MTSPFANNAVVPPKIATDYYLRSTKEGVPLDRQVPRTTQVPSATTGIVVPTADRNMTIATLTGPLTIDFANNFRNYIGKDYVILVNSGVGQTVTLSFNAALPARVTGAAGTTTSVVVAASANNQTVRLIFMDTVVAANVN